MWIVVVAVVVLVVLVAAVVRRRRWAWRPVRPADLGSALERAREKQRRRD